MKNVCGKIIRVGNIRGHCRGNVRRNCPCGELSRGNIQGVTELSARKCLGKLFRWGMSGRVIVRFSTQDFKPLRVAVMICATLVNTHAHLHTAFDSGRSYTIRSATYVWRPGSAQTRWDSLTLREGYMEVNISGSNTLE